MMIDCEVALGVVGYWPAGDLAPIHGQDPSWCYFLLYWDSTCFGISLVDKVLGYPAVY